MNYKPVVAGNQSNGNAGTKACDDAGKARMETVPGKDYILLPLWTADPPFSQSLKSSPDDGFKPSRDDKKKDADVNSTNSVYTVSSPVNIVGSSFINDDGSTLVNAADLPDDPNMPLLEDIVYSDDDEDVGAEADMNNLDAFMPVRQNQKGNSCIEEFKLDRGYARRTLTQFKLQEVWTLVDLPNEKRAIGFEDPDFPDRVYKVEKALYGLHQALIAWYETLLTYLLYNEFQRGKLDKTLFIKRYKDEFYGRTYILLGITSAREEGWHIY
ncbi:putative ribonuclease H-like domain-containing protein [Tanacetum coccineum]